ncbi:hypothetical protein CVT26_015688 [Gymnopilus dilepis]|uniref:Uncharacterized protein n=1 Tax=Gymnopilus dilepis TaxID=231916 RepID=A0A409WMD9_9AGAR|nr:hypothetical protein CVT26_015688 [Gymnopilus dilepis]
MRRSEDLQLNRSIQSQTHKKKIGLFQNTCNVAAFDELPASHIGQIRSSRPPLQTQPSAYYLPESPYHTVDGYGTVCTAISHEDSHIPQSQPSSTVHGPYLPHPEIFEAIAYGQHRIEQTKPLTTLHNSAVEYQGITTPHHPVHSQKVPAVEVTSAIHTIPSSCPETVPSITATSSPSNPIRTTNNPHPETPALIHQPSNNIINYPSYNEIDIIPYRPFSVDGNTTTRLSGRVHVGTPHFFPPIENDMTTYERKMLYMNSLERYVIHLHQHLVAIGINPPRIEKTTKTKKISPMALQVSYFPYRYHLMKHVIVVSLNSASQQFYNICT